MKIKHNYNRHEHDERGEYNTLPSMTVPDQAMSIPELIRRYASGLPLLGQRVPMFDDDPTTDVLGGKPFASFDLSEQFQLRDQAIENYNNTIKNLRNGKPTEPNIQKEQKPESETIS